MLACQDLDKQKVRKKQEERAQGWGCLTDRRDDIKVEGHAQWASLCESHFHDPSLCHCRGWRVARRLRGGHNNAASQQQVRGLAHFAARLRQRGLARTPIVAHLHQASERGVGRRILCAVVAPSKEAAIRPGQPLLLGGSGLCWSNDSASFLQAETLELGRPVHRGSFHPEHPTPPLADGLAVVLEKLHEVLIDSGQLVRERGLLLADRLRLLRVREHIRNPTRRH